MSSMTATLCAGGGWASRAGVAGVDCRRLHDHTGRAHLEDAIVLVGEQRLLAVRIALRSPDALDEL